MVGLDKKINKNIMQNKIDFILTKLIKEELNRSFINENKLYPSNIIFNLTKKLGDNSDDTLNKLAVFGLFRQASPFNVIKDINQLQSLDQLNELFNKWKESALQGLITTDGPLKGNKTAALTYLEAYIKNIKSLGNNAKPFSYREAEKTLIDVANYSGWVKSNDNSTQTHGIDSPDKQDILFEDNTVLIVKAPSKAKCIMYGQGKSWCISQTGLNMYNTYRIKYGATIYFVLNKTKSKEDKERTCVILRYSGDKYGIADATNSGQRSGGLEVAVDGFDEVESELPWLRGKGQYFTESEVTQSEKEYAKVSETPYNGDDLGNYIINTAKGLKFNGEEVDPVDLFRDYMTGKELTTNQFKSLTEPMKVQLIEMGYSLNKEIILNLDSNLKVRYGLIRIKNKNNINLGLYDDEEVYRVLNNINDKLDYYVIDNLLRYTTHPYTLIKQMLPFVKDNINYHMIKQFLTFIPYDDGVMGSKNGTKLIQDILPLVKNNLDIDIIFLFQKHTLPELRYNLTQQIIPLIQDKIDSNMLERILDFTPGYRNSTVLAQQYDLIQQLLPVIKDNLDGNIIGVLLKHTQSGQGYKLIQDLLPFIKDKLDYNMEVKILSNAHKDDIPKIKKY